MADVQNFLDDSSLVSPCADHRQQPTSKYCCSSQRQRPPQPSNLSTPTTDFVPFYFPVAPHLFFQQHPKSNQQQKQDSYIFYRHSIPSAFSTYENGVITPVEEQSEAQTKTQFIMPEPVSILSLCIVSLISSSPSPSPPRNLEIPRQRW